MIDYTLGEIEGRFADLIWENEPVSSGTLVKLAEEALGWKKSTTYTVLKRLANRGLFINQGGTVTSQIPKSEFSARQTRQFVQRHFGDSLPDFIAAFTDGRKLKPEEIRALRDLILKDGEQDD